jgi:3-phosphoshikimate 1-carboxyvinyltransferase
MDCTIYPGKVSGTVKAPASKSYAQRAILASALSKGLSVLKHFEFSDDTWHASHNAVNMGASIRQFGDQLEIKGDPLARVDHFYAGESGLTARMLSAILMIFEGSKILSGSGSLTSRPFDPIFKVYEELGVPYQSNLGKLPLQIGSMSRSRDIHIDASLSSQFISGLLLALPYIGFQKRLILENPRSLAYIEMTIDLLKSFGVEWEVSEDHIYRLSSGSQYRPCHYTIEGDWSGAAFLLAAGLGAGTIRIKNLQRDSKQADRAIMSILAHDAFDWNEDLLVFPQKQQAFDFDATDCPDLFPPLASIAALSGGSSTIKGIHRLKHKESNRALTLQEEFAKLWVRIDLQDDVMIVHPSKPTGGVVKAHNDHRIAMAMSILALNASEPVTIRGVECVSKSYPQFYEDLRKLGVRLEMG